MSLKQKWIEALRSGEYQQGIEYLVVEEGGYRGYCCLGVLCKVAGWEDDQIRGILDKEAIYNNMLPESWLDWDTQKQLSKMNDNHVDFGAIADFIEDNVPEESIKVEVKGVAGEVSPG